MNKLNALAAATVQAQPVANAEPRTPNQALINRYCVTCHNQRLKTAKLELDTPNGYDITVTASLGIAEHVMKTKPAGGYYTPSQLMGADYVLGLPGVALVKPGA